MPLPQRFFPGDEELGKKDDEYKRPEGNRKSRIWQQKRLPHPPQRRSVKRIALAILAALTLYYFVKNIPTDGKPRNVRPQFVHGEYRGTLTGDKPIRGQSRTEEKGKGVAGHAGHAEQGERNFNGPIKFYDLASTLHSAARYGGTASYNDNILFAAASLKSAAILLPIACEMALRERNNVHFAFLGRDDIPMDMLKSVNGITKECKMMFHDARPDFPLKSTDFRMEVSCSAAFNHINDFVHPQATLIDGSGLEESYFLKGVNDRANYLGSTLIELPENVEQSLMWITLLDSSSLSAWNKVTIDLVVHAQPSASGSLLRLLESLKKADFFGTVPPRLTIELPNIIDAPTKKYLEGFKWPPGVGQGHGSTLTIHHRIPQHGLTGEENSIRFLESFWPSNQGYSHVMVLSPQVELSPLFYHYLKYALLEYRYSEIHPLSQNLLGISLELPSTYLNDTPTFEAPTNGTAIPFLWQAPNSNAALYFGDKWVEMHSFISNILISEHDLSTPTTLNQKEVSKTYPSWLEHVLKLARARGYTTIYPNFESRDVLVTLHNELFQAPEEYKKQEKVKKVGELGADVNDHLSLKHKEQPLASSKGLLSILGGDGRLPALVDLPILRYDGEDVDALELGIGAGKFAKVFRREIGGCTDDEQEEFGDDTDELFCLEDNVDR